MSELPDKMKINVYHFGTFQNYFRQFWLNLTDNLKQFLQVSK